ncbi:hypothetical protein [Caballeronia grimmiae]|uniref:hypothetical protein n=1 Tax=Caballeronia grimmiae TaxID=1071679 RepID=UPI0038B8677E
MHENLKTAPGASAISAKSPEGFSRTAPPLSAKGAKSTFCHFCHCTPGLLLKKAACVARGIGYTRNVSETTDAGFSSLNNRSAQTAQSGFFVPIAFARLFQWAGLGGGAARLAGFFGCRSANPASCPLTPFSSGQRAFTKPKEPAMRANASARSELPESQVIALAQSSLTLEIISRALRDAALANNVYDALDCCGDALLNVAQLIRAEVRHG